MNVTLLKTITNNNELRTMNYQKQTQSNPIYGEPAEPTKPILSQAQSRELSKQLLPHPLNPHIMSILYGDKNGKTPNTKTGA
jgi:hypothetical protein